MYMYYFSQGKLQPATYEFSDQTLNSFNNKSKIISYSNWMKECSQISIKLSWMCISAIKTHTHIYIYIYIYIIYTCRCHNLHIQCYDLTVFQPFLTTFFIAPDTRNRSKIQMKYWNLTWIYPLKSAVNFVARLSN
jgi:hypothetical protein